MTKHTLGSFALGLLLACSSPSLSSSGPPAPGAPDAPTGSPGPSSSPPIATSKNQGSVALPGGAAGVGLDDLRFSAKLGRIVSPGGRTGNVNLVDADNFAMTSVSGFPVWTTFDGSDQQGVESADEGGGMVFAVDRAKFTLSVIDPAQKAIVDVVPLELTEPDYIRYVESTSEVWITNPGSSRIDVLSVPKHGPPVQAAFIPVKGGVEGLAIDNVRGRAYTHNFGGSVAVIDIKTRAVIATWPTGCSSSHGIPSVDVEHGLLFCGCGSAKTFVLDADHDGRQLDSYGLGSGATILAYSPSLRHLYMRGDPGTTVAMLGVSAAGVLTLLGNVEATSKGHCMAADDRGNLWVCDWKDGRLIRFKDPYPASK